MTRQKLDEAVETIKDQLIRKYKAEKVILFGSASRGEFKKDSDLDFLIIKEGVPYFGVDRIREVEKLVQTNYPCDFLVARPSEIKERLKLGDPFLKSIIEEGKVLYG